MERVRADGGARIEEWKEGRKNKEVKQGKEGGKEAVRLGRSGVGREAVGREVGRDKFLWYRYGASTIVLVF